MRYFRSENGSKARASYRKNKPRTSNRSGIKPLTFLCWHFLESGILPLIDEIEIEFGDGLNLLTGETGSGKSIIVDSLGALTGERVTSDLIKEGQTSAQIEGLFSVRATRLFVRCWTKRGIELDAGERSR